jgi:hypothetical protein
MTTESRRRVELTYPPELLSEPILFRLITEYQITVNVIEARVTPDEAWFVIDLDGSELAVVSGLCWLAEQGIQVRDLPGLSNSQGGPASPVSA